MDAPVTRPFTNLQWYLAHARNTVHMAVFTREALSRDAVVTMIDRAVCHSPHLMMGESIIENRHHQVPGVKPADVLDYQTVDQLEINQASWMNPRVGEFTDTGRPAFKAWYVAGKKPDEDGNKGFLLLQTTHALAEGSDLGAILRDQDAVRPDLRETALPPEWPAKLSLVTLAPLAAIAHLIGALFEKKKPQDFEFLSLAAPNPEIVRAAKKLGVSRKTLLFAAVLYAVTGPANSKGKQLFAYSALPKKRISLDADTYLKLQMQLLTIAKNADFAEFAHSVQGATEKQMRSGVFTQLFYNQVLVSQRLLQRFLPFLYHRKFFGQAPYDIVLSLLPPVRPRAGFEALGDGPIYAGSYTGTVQNCIFISGQKDTTLNFWLHKSLKPNLASLRALLKDLGIETTPLA